MFNRATLAFLSLCLAVVCLAAATATADEIVPSERVESRVNVRAEPSKSSPVVGKLLKGMAAKFLESVPRYYRIRLPNGVEGYVAKSWTERIASGPSIPPPTSAAADSGKLEIQHFARAMTSPNAAFWDRRNQLMLRL